MDTVYIRHHASPRGWIVLTGPDYLAPLSRWVAATEHPAPYTPDQALTLGARVYLAVDDHGHTLTRREAVPGPTIAGTPHPRARWSP